MIPGRGEVRWVDPGGRIMPQRHLPLFPAGVTHITNELAFERRDGKIAYFNGHMPVFVHAEDDVATFRMITSQFCESGYAKQSDIIRAFGVTSISVKRAVKLYRERGTKGFYARRVSRGSAVLTASVMAEIESLLVEGVSLGEVAQKLGLKLNTLQKAVSAGRIRPAAKKTWWRADSDEHEKPAIRNRLRRADGPWGHGDAGTDGGQPWTARGGRAEFQPGRRSSSRRGFASAARAVGQRTVEPYEQILQPACRLLWSQDDLSAVGFHVAGSDQIDRSPALSCAGRVGETARRRSGSGSAHDTKQGEASGQPGAGFFLERRALQDMDGRDRAVQRSLLRVMENIALRPARAAAKRSCGIESDWLQRRILYAMLLSLATIPGFVRMREASSRKVTSRV